MKKKYFLKELKYIELSIPKPSIVFLKGNLGAGKTTLSKHILSKILSVQVNVTSPTYTYYNKYEENYHFDLYRLKDYDEFFAIGGEEILDNNQGVILIEWPEIIEKYYVPDIVIHLHKTSIKGEREIEVIKRGEKDIEIIKK